MLACDFNHLPPNVSVLAVTKYASIEQITALYNLGFTHFGENKIQTAIEKQSQLTHLSCKWHFIGHLQSNKIKKAVTHFDCIESVHSADLALKISNYAKKINKEITILFQINLTNESTKHGFKINEFKQDLPKMMSLPFIQPKGIMIMGPNTTKKNEIESTFNQANRLYTTIKTRYNCLTILSMGMSNDYLTAIEYGSTQVRLGSILLDQLKKETK